MRLALLGGEERRGRLLDQLLVAALQRAVAGADDDRRCRAGRPGTWASTWRGLVEVTLDEALAAAERGDRLAGRRLEQIGDLLDRCGRP